MKAIPILGLLALLVGSASADTAAEWKLPEGEGPKWVARVKEIVRDGWSVERRENEIAVRRSKQVAMVRILPNSSEDAKPLPDGERLVTFVLRFATKMSLDEYDRLSAVNAASEKEYDRLHRAVDLPDNGLHVLRVAAGNAPQQVRRCLDRQPVTGELGVQPAPARRVRESAVNEDNGWVGHIGSPRS